MAPTFLHGKLKALTIPLHLHPLSNAPSLMLRSIFSSEKSTSHNFPENYSPVILLQLHSHNISSFKFVCFIVGCGWLTIEFEKTKVFKVLLAGKVRKSVICGTL